MKLLWSDEARSDLLDAYVFIAADNPAAAEKVQERLVAAAEILIDFPYRGRAGRRASTRETPVPHTPYLLVYSVSGDAVTIVRIWHGSREPFE